MMLYTMSVLNSKFKNDVVVANSETLVRTLFSFEGLMRKRK